MVLRRITIDNSVRYIPKSVQTKEIKQNMIKKNKVNKINLFQEEVNQTKIFHEIVKNLLKILQQEVLENLQNSICTSIRIIILLFV